MNILIVDNDTSIRKALRMGLTRPEWNIDDVPTDSICAADFIRGSQYNIIIVDLDMEDPCALDIIREEKQQDHKLIVVGMTRNSISDFFLKDNKNSFNACYQKPMHLNMLKKAIELELQKIVLL